VDSPEHVSGIIASGAILGSRRETVEPKLAAGTFYGKIQTQRRVLGLGLAESLYSPSFMIPRHSHESAYFGLVLQGTYRETYDGRTRECGPFTLLFHPSGELHAERHDDVLVRIFSIELCPMWRDRLPEHGAALRTPGCFRSGSLPRLALRLYEEFQTNDPVVPLAIEGLMLELLAETCRESGHPDDSRAPRWLRRVRDLLSEQCTGSLSLGRIASSMNVHPTHLCRAFRQHYHCTPGDFVRQQRIERARQYLASSDTPLVEIALRVGYSDQSHFATAFKRLTGLTPSQFRQMSRKR
jgi:AraC family transcriptional regulator